MAALVYHHTEIARLPWILDAGALRPGRCTVGNYPDPDFLWGTVCAAGRVLVGETMWLSQQITPADAPRKFRLRGMPLDAFVRWVERAAVIEPPPGMLPDGSLNIVGDAK
jgi:hypothetical protein